MVEVDKIFWLSAFWVSSWTLLRLLNLLCLLVGSSIFVDPLTWMMNCAPRMFKRCWKEEFPGWMISVVYDVWLWPSLWDILVQIPIHICTWWLLLYRWHVHWHVASAEKALHCLCDHAFLDCISLCRTYFEAIEVYEGGIGCSKKEAVAVV